MTEFIYKLKSNFISTLPYNNSIYKAKAADGLQLYRQISIDDLKQDAETISNRVDGFTTTIDKNNLLNSSCTCNDADFCQHQFALVFFLYAQYEPLTTLFEEWRSAEAKNLFIQQKSGLLFLTTILLKRGSIDLIQHTSNFRKHNPPRTCLFFKIYTMNFYIITKNSSS